MGKHSTGSRASLGTSNETSSHVWLDCTDKLKHAVSVCVHVCACVCMCVHVCALCVHVGFVIAVVTEFMS